MLCLRPLWGLWRIEEDLIPVQPGGTQALNPTVPFSINPHQSVQKTILKRTYFQPCLAGRGGLSLRRAALPPPSVKDDSFSISSSFSSSAPLQQPGLSKQGQTPHAPSMPEQEVHEDGSCIVLPAPEPSPDLVSDDDQPLALRQAGSAPPGKAHRDPQVRLRMDSLSKLDPFEGDRNRLERWPLRGRVRVFERHSSPFQVTETGRLCLRIQDLLEHTAFA